MKRSEVISIIWEIVSQLDDAALMVDFRNTLSREYHNEILQEQS